MTQTPTTDRLKQITDAISAEPHDYESIYDSIKHGEIAAMARELLANREAQPVGYIAEVSGNRVGVLRGLPMPDVGSLIYTAPPAPAVPTFEEWLLTQENKPLGWVRDSMKESYDACRAAMLAQPVSQGGKLDSLNIRAVSALREAVRNQWLKSNEFAEKVYWHNMHSIANEIIEAMAAAPVGGN